MEYISTKCTLVFILIFQLFHPKCESFMLPNTLMQITSDAAIYPGLKKTDLKLVFSEVGSFDDLIEATAEEGFLKIGLFCVERGAFILYRKPDFNIDNAEDFKIASGEDRCFTPTGIESAQPIGPLAFPKRDSITFFARNNFASMAYPTALNITTRSFFASLRSAIRSLIIIGKTSWTLVTAKGDRFCVSPKGYDDNEKNPICMLPDMSDTKIKLPGVHLVKVIKGCVDVNVTIEVNFCSYWGAIPDVTGDGSKTMIEDEMSGRSDTDACSGGGDSDRMLKDTLYFLKNLVTEAYIKPVVLDFNGVTNLKWKLEMLDTIWDIAKKTMPSSLISLSYMHKVREYFVSELANGWRRQMGDGSAGGNDTDEIVAGILTEYDYRGMLHQTTECLGLIDDDTAKTNLAAWNGITSPNGTKELVWSGLMRVKDYNIIVEMAWVIFNMVGGLCHKMFGYVHNFWALYIHFVVNMYLIPLADIEWIRPAELGDMKIILGGDMETKYDQMAIWASMALFAANSLEPFQRPIKPKINDTTTRNPYG